MIDNQFSNYDASEKIKQSLPTPEFSADELSKAKRQSAKMLELMAKRGYPHAKDAQGNVIPREIFAEVFREAQQST